MGQGSTVRVMGHPYSVPSRLVGEKVAVRVHETRVEVYFGGERQAQIGWKSIPKRTIVGHIGAPELRGAFGAKSDNAAESVESGRAVPAVTEASAAAGGSAPPSGTHPVVVQSKEDEPFAAFAEAILPTPEQVQQLTSHGYQEYVQLQVDERLRALERLLGSDLGDDAREELHRFYEDWAYRKFLAHQDWLAKIERATPIADAEERQEALNAAGKEWALEFARLKSEQRSKLSETFAGPTFRKYEALLDRYAKYSEVAAALRVPGSKKKE